jgi:hypothetical protein
VQEVKFPTTVVVGWQDIVVLVARVVTVMTVVPSGLDGACVESPG